MFCIAQPMPCDIENPEMTSFCDEACVICDIDGFTGRHQATIVGQAPPGFAGECTIDAHNMQWIAFIAGSVDLRVRLSVSNCEDNLGLEFGLYKGVNCMNFKRISNCFGGFNAIGPGESGVISNTESLVIGQYYFIVMDGGLGDNCDWTFTVEEGSTKTAPLTFTREIEGPAIFCPDVEVSYVTEAELGATLFFWTLDGQAVGNENSNQLNLSLPSSGTYTLCVTAANACDEAIPNCRQIEVIENPETYLSDVFCEGECFEINGNSYCESGVYDFTIALPNGCDSIIFIDLEELDQAINTLDINICEGDTIYIDGVPYSETDMYQQVVLTENDCDSLVNLDLFVIICDIKANYTATPPKCHDSFDGKISFKVVQGTLPFTYVWKTLNGTEFGTPQIINDTISSIFLNDLNAEQYIIEISDEFGNSEILHINLEAPEPLIVSVLSSDYNGYGVSCNTSFDGFLSADVSGGEVPYNIGWSTGTFGEGIENLAPDLYALAVTDANGCMKVSTHDITAPAPIEATLILNNPDCMSLETGSIQVNSVSGGTSPFQYQIENSTFQNEDIFNELGPDSYSIQVVDANGCSAEFNATLTAPQIPVISLPEDITIPLGDSVIISASTNTIEIESIEWSSTEFLSCPECLEIQVQGLHSADYFLEIISEDGCASRESIHIEVEKSYAFYAPNIFSPNSDGQNDEFTIYKSSEIENLHLYIYDRWGSIIYDDQGRGVPWIGVKDGKPIGIGVYTWIVDIDFIDGVSKMYSGNVSVIR